MTNLIINYPLDNKKHYLIKYNNKYVYRCNIKREADKIILLNNFKDRIVQSEKFCTRCKRFL